MALAHALVETGHYRMTHIAAALGVSRSNLTVRRDGKHTGRPARYNKAEDLCLLPIISQLCSARGSNGYRRITARLNRLLPKRVNPKRIYRLMKDHHLLLQRYSGRPDERCHTGKIVTLKPNIRWCSDGFEIKCWNKDIVRVAFSLDCCDREAMRYVATTGGITAVMVQDLLVETMEYRFASRDQLPHAVEWLTDNGSCYIARETRAFAANLGFTVCTTPVRSPQSNGMAEAFVKTFKRDYVYLNEVPDARTVMMQLPAWFADYNASHPHKGLKMKSPWEYQKQLALSD